MKHPVMFKGYGDLSPCSTAGQALIIIFTLIGTPIMIASMSSIAKLFCLIFHKLWCLRLRICYRGKFTRRQIKLMNKKHYLPLYLGILITLGWIMLSTTYFYFYLRDDPLTVFQSFYFTMVSFLTIGFGDYYPARHNLILIVFFFLFIGLSLVAMCIELIQARLEILYDDMINAVLETADLIKEDEMSADSNSSKGLQFSKIQSHDLLNENK